MKSNKMIILAPSSCTEASRNPIARMSTCRSVLNSCAKVRSQVDVGCEVYAEENDRRSIDHYSYSAMLGSQIPFFTTACESRSE